MSPLFFILGAHKTASSTLVGMLNCHPDILALYETDLTTVQISRYGGRLIEVCPASRQHFTHSTPPAESYRALCATLHAAGHRYQRLGDKLITLNPALLGTLRGLPLIVSTRDIRTWLVKSAIVSAYRTDVDALPAAQAFARFLVESHRHPNVLRLSVETIAQEPHVAIARLSAHLNIDLAAHTADWSHKIGTSSDPIKMAQAWYSGHQSSNISDGQLDSRVTLKPHPMWDTLLPIFDRYLTEAATPERIEDDLAALGGLGRLGPVPLDALYDTIDTTIRKLPKGRKYLYSAYRKAPRLVRRLPGWPKS